MEIKRTAGRFAGIDRKRKEAHARLLRLDSRVYKAFLEMEKVAIP